MGEISDTTRFSVAGAIAVPAFLVAAFVLVLLIFGWVHSSKYTMGLFILSGAMIFLSVLIIAIGYILKPKGAAGCINVKEAEELKAKNQALETECTANIKEANEKIRDLKKQLNEKNKIQ